MTVLCVTGVSLSCAAALAPLDGYRVWSTPDTEPSCRGTVGADEEARCAITFGGAEEEARAAVVAELRALFIGDWDYEVMLAPPPVVAPCAWCARHKRYSH